MMKVKMPPGERIWLLLNDENSCDVNLELATTASIVDAVIRNIIELAGLGRPDSPMGGIPAE